MVRKLLAVATTAIWINTTVFASSASADWICAEVVVHNNGTEYPAGGCIVDTSIPTRTSPAKIGLEPTLYAEVTVSHP
jgi:hypothetical protein